MWTTSKFQFGQLLGSNGSSHTCRCGSIISGHRLSFCHRTLYHGPYIEATFASLSSLQKSVFFCNTVHELKCLQMKRVVCFNLHSNFNRTRNLVMDFDFTSGSRQKQTRTNLRDLMFLGPTTGLHKQAMTSLHPKVWPGCGNNDAILHREVVIGQATNSPLLNDDLRTYIRNHIAPEFIS